MLTPEQCSGYGEAVFDDLSKMAPTPQLLEYGSCDSGRKIGPDRLEGIIVRYSKMLLADRRAVAPALDNKLELTTKFTKNLLHAIRNSNITTSPHPIHTGCREAEAIFSSIVYNRYPRGVVICQSDRPIGYLKVSDGEETIIGVGNDYGAPLQPGVISEIADVTTWRAMTRIIDDVKKNTKEKGLIARVHLEDILSTQGEATGRRIQPTEIFRAIRVSALVDPIACAILTNTPRLPRDANPVALDKLTESIASRPQEDVTKTQLTKIFDKTLLQKPV